MNAENVDILWILVAAALVMAMQIGFCFLESGLVRAKNSINVAIKNLADFCISAAIFWLVGFGIMFGYGSFGLWGTSFFFFDVPDNWWLSAFFIFQLVFCGTAITIISGAVAERMRFGAYMVVAVFTSGLVYPFFGHWAWGGAVAGTPPGWLAELGFLDFAGSTVVHSVGGWVALAAILVIGSRIGRFDDPDRSIHGHNITFASAGVLILWFGWLGFNGGSTLAMNETVPKIIANTVIGGAFGGLTAMASAYVYYGMARTWAIMNGIIGGLVSVTAACNVISTPSAAIIGGIAGILCFFGIRLLEKLKIDDAVGAVPAHAFCGAWGTLAVAIFGVPELWNTGHGRLEQLGVQAIGVFTCFLWTFISAYLFFKTLNKFVPLRVTADEEKMGLNVSEHGATTELIDLITEMDSQERGGSFQKRVHVEPHTEVGQIAAEYNRVLNRVEEEFLRREKATDEARSAQAQAVKADQVKSNFLANMSHELRTPLGIIMGYVDLIEEDLKEGNAVDSADFQTIAQSSQHLLHLINGVLDISKVESGKMDIYPESIDLANLIGDLRQTVKPLVSENQNTLEIQVAENPGVIFNDRIKLQQCLLNLISNACKFTKDGRIVLRLKRESWNNGIECLFIDVEDTGIGIDPEDADSIFKPFTQVDTSESREFEGTGLGLAITRSFCKLMGGDVFLRSELGKGSCFTMRIRANLRSESDPNPSDSEPPST